MRRAYLVALAAFAVTMLLEAGTVPIRCPSPDLATLVLERDGSGWALQGNRGHDPLYFAGGAFHQLIGGEPPGMTYYDSILGDAKHGYYLERFDHEPPCKRIYRLIDGEARLFCEPLSLGQNSFELTGNTYVASDGRVVSWDERRLALWSYDAWQFLPAKTPRHVGLPIVIEHQGHIIMVNAQDMHVIDPYGNVATHNPGWAGLTAACFHWQGAVALRLAEDEAGVEAFDLLRGVRRPLPAPLAALKEPVQALYRSSAGTAWAKTAQALYRLDKQPTRFELPSAEADIIAIAERGAATADGAPRWDIFFTDSRRPGLWRWNAAGTEQWDTRHGLHGSVCDARLGADGVLWFVCRTMDETRLFRLPLDPPAAPPQSDPERWHQFDLLPGTRLMDLGGTVACIPPRGNLLLRWDGTAWIEQPWSEIPERGMVNRTAWDDRGTVYLQFRNDGPTFNTAAAPPYDGPVNLQFRNDGPMFNPLAELTPAKITVINDGSRNDYHMLEALQRSADRGATRVTFGDDQGIALITPQKDIWTSTEGRFMVRHFDGTIWRDIPNGRNVTAFEWSAKEGVIMSLDDGSTKVYANGLFEPRTDPTNPPPPDIFKRRAAVSLPSDHLAATPLADRQVHTHFADSAGNLWFWLRQENRACLFKLDDLRLSAGADPLDTQPGSLKIKVAATPVPDTLNYVYRLNGAEEWRSLLTPQGAPLRLRFSQSGSYTCEVAAVVYGVRLPRTASFVHTVNVTLPEIKALTPHDGAEPLLVTTYGWRPPLEVVPTSYANRCVCETVWRMAAPGESWRTLDPDGRFPLQHFETNGTYRIEFSAREERTRLASAAVLLTLRLAMDDNGLLLLTLDNLAATDPATRSRAAERLTANRARWLPLLRLMNEQAHDAVSRRDSLRQLDEELRRYGY